MAGVNDLLLRLRRGEYYDPDYLRDPDSAETQIDHAFLMVPPSYSIPPPPFWRRTALWRAAKRIRNRIFQPPPQDPHGEVVRFWRERRAQAGEYLDALPPMEEAHREFIANLDRIVHYAARKDYRLILVTQPALWKANMPAEETASLWMGGVGNFKQSPGQPYYTPAALARGLDGYNRLLRDYCLWRGVECIDLAQGFPRDLGHFYDDCHFTVEGADLVARIVAGYLLQGPPWRRRAEGL
ncbi:MAG TPA: hypothetical protein PLI51_07580 [bacterium]|nr:hypothetical protein [bacterium]